MKKKLKIIIIIILIITLITVIIRYINNTISPKLVNYAELEIRKISGLIITKSISEETLEKLNTNNLFIINRNNNNEILTVDLNTVEINKIIREATNNIEENLKQLEEGNVDKNNKKNKKGVILEIPLGMIYNNFLLNNKGPKIPVKLKIIGDLEIETNTKITNYGINSALIEITLDITIKEEVILPITTKKITVTNKTPIAIKLIQGSVPNYYSDGINKSQTFSIPLE
jgi:sporulation protein YunB